MSIRIVFLSMDPRGYSSFGCQTDLLCTELQKRGYDIHCLGISKRNKPEKFNGYMLYPYPGDLGRRKNIHYGNLELFTEYLDLLQPDILITLGNIAKIEYISTVYKQKYSAIPWLHSGPIETPVVYKDMLTLEKTPNIFITLTEFAFKKQKQLLKNVVKIGHAVEPKVFRPLAKQAVQSARKKLGFKNTDYIVGSLGTNDIRKQFLRLLEAFAIFSKDKPRAKLLIYTTAYEPADNTTVDLEYYLDNIFNLRKKVKIIYTNKLEHIPTPEDLNKYFYNVIDCFALATAGEGFCLPIAEAMFCQKPVIATRCENLDELIKHKKTGLLCKTIGKLYDLVPHSYAPWSIVDIKDLAANLNKLYKSKTLRAKLASAGYKHVLANFELKVITDKWKKLMTSLSVPLSASQRETIDISYIQSWLGLEYFKHGLFKDCIIITHDLSNAAIHNIRGHAYKRLGLLPEAKEEFQRALELDPGMELARRALAGINS